MKNKKGIVEMMTEYAIIVVAVTMIILIFIAVFVVFEKIADKPTFKVEVDAISSTGSVHCNQILLGLMRFNSGTDDLTYAELASRVYDDTYVQAFNSSFILLVNNYIYYEVGTAVDYESKWYAEVSNSSYTFLRFGNSTISNKNSCSYTIPTLNKDNIIILLRLGELE